MLREKTHYKSNTISIPFQNQIIKIPVAVEENEEKWKILSKINSNYFLADYSSPYTKDYDEENYLPELIWILRKNTTSYYLLLFRFSANEHCISISVLQSISSIGVWSAFVIILLSYYYRFLGLKKKCCRNLQFIHGWCFIIKMKFLDLIMYSVSRSYEIVTCYRNPIYCNIIQRILFISWLAS